MKINPIANKNAVNYKKMIAAGVKQEVAVKHLTQRILQDLQEVVMVKPVEDKPKIIVVSR